MQSALPQHSAGRHDHPCRRCLWRLPSLRFSAIYYVDIDRNALTLKERLLKTLYMLSFSHGKRITDGQDIVLIWLNGIGGMLME